MDFDRYADSKQARHHSLGGFESRTVGSDIVQEVSGPSVVSKKTASPVSIYAKVRTMDGQIKNRVIETTELVTVEESAPPSPTIGPTPNFDEVASGIYRSSFPRAGNFEHLQTFGLKTILTLVGHDYPEDNVKFLKENGIKHFQIPIPAHKDESIKIPIESVQKALQIILDRRNHPILIHCNKGKHRTGCIVACYRKLHDVPLPEIISEYRKYATNKARALDEKFIEEFDETAIMAGLTKSTMVAASTETTYITLGPMLTPPPSTKDGSLRDFCEL